MQFADAVQDAAGRDWIRGVFSKLKTNSDRISILYSDPKLKDIVLTTLSHVQEIYRKKSAEVSLARRFEAQQAFNNDQLQKTLLLLCQAVLRAPKTGEFPQMDGGLSLCLALWARSDVLMRLNKYNLALQDVQVALKEGLPAAQKAEAFWRMAICYKALNEDKKCQVSKQLVLKLLNNNESSRILLEDSLRKTYKDAGSLINPRRCLSYLEENVLLPGGSRKLEVKSAPNKGRFIVAKEYIPTGELIIQEDAYASCLLPENFGTHCHHCYDRLEAPLGCYDCSSVAFCGVTCRDKALSTYHKHECHFVDLLIGSGMSILAHVALRMITQKPLDYLLERHKEMKEGKAKGVYNLCTLSEFRNPADFLQRSVMAAFLLRCLQKCGYFGKEADLVIPNETQMKIGELLLYNLQMLQFNAHEIYETKITSENRLLGAANYIGVAVYASAALFNHDCSPAVTRHFVGKYIVLRTCRPIKTGQEISDNYGPNYSRKNLKERQKYLKGRYWFECKCTACTQNWPLLEGLEKLDSRLKCPYSESSVLKRKENERKNNSDRKEGETLKETSCDYMFTLPMKVNDGKCPRCKNQVNFKAMSEEFNRVEGILDLATKCIDMKDVQSGIKLCCQGLDAYYKISTAPHYTVQLIEECLRALFADSGNMWEPTIVDAKPMKARFVAPENNSATIKEITDGSKS